MVFCDVLAVGRGIYEGLVLCFEQSRGLVKVTSPLSSPCMFAIWKTVFVFNGSAPGSGNLVTAEMELMFFCGFSWMQSEHPCHE